MMYIHLNLLVMAKIFLIYLKNKMKVKNNLHFVEIIQLKRLFQQKRW